ncbi:MAG: hypothetical protein AAGG50_12775 [Bacteroidota bacterium]
MPSSQSAHIRIIAAIEVLAGVIGLFLVLSYLTAQPVALPIWISAMGLLFFSLSVWAGIALWLGKPHGYVLSIVAWSLQVVQVLAPFELIFRAGPYLILSLSSTLNVGFDIGALSGFFLGGTTGPGWELGINVFALAMALLLGRAIEDQQQQDHLAASIEREKDRMAANEQRKPK